MNKRLIISSIVIILSLNLVVAGLCKGSDGYYHDCEDLRYKDYYEYDDKWIDNYDSPKRTYYSGGGRFEKIKDKTDYYKDVEEYKRTTESKYEDEYGFEKIKTTIHETVEIEREERIPQYRFEPSRNTRYSNVAFSSWRYKEPYDYYDYNNEDYWNYYYKPRYDHNPGHYNWRW